MGEKNTVVKLHDAFYRDSLGKIIWIIVGVCLAFIFLIALAIYLYLDKPAPITFPVGSDMRVQSAVPLDQPYLLTSDLLQWVSEVLPQSFFLDFNRYNVQLKEHSQAFTPDGWKTFLNQLNIYANYNNVQTYKLFITASPAGAPVILRQGVIPESGKYGWWVQMPVNIIYSGFKPPQNTTLDLQLLVIRVSTLNNLMGVGIDNVIQAPLPATNSNRNG